jgi:transcriptional regulator with XRE-family HTH domain
VPESPDDFVRHVTRRVRDIRRAKGITQDGLAESLGTATKNIQRIEAGQNLTLRTLARLARALGVAPAELLADDTATSRAYALGNPQPAIAANEVPPRRGKVGAKRVARRK